MSHNNQSYNGWTLDREELLKKLHKEGLSASQIAARITSTGFECSRNAVIGKANRMGLTGGDKPRRSTRCPKPRRKPKVGGAINLVFGGRKSAKLFADVYVQAEAFTPGPELVVPENERRGIDGLTEDQCRWPIGDPQMTDFHFCNGAKVPGLPYCLHHSRRAYQPPQERRKRIPVHYVNNTSVNDITWGVEVLQNGEAPINTREKSDA
jgi:GcrA cell cycle regulator